MVVKNIMVCALYDAESFISEDAGELFFLK